MSKIAITGNASGTGVFTLAAPDSNSDYTITLPQASGTLATADTAGFPTGTVMMFVQTAAPTGWTKDTSHDNKALRVVSGTAGSGGSVAFTTAFAAGLLADATTLTTAQIPSHTHTFGTSTASLTGGFGNVFTGQGGPSASGIVSASILANNTGGGGSTQQRWNFGIDASHSHSGTTDGTGGGDSHTHGLPSFDVQYVDVIIATKD